MKEAFLARLRCPACGTEHEVRDARHERGEVASGTLVCRNGHAWPLVGFIPRFVPPENYAWSFGFQWNRFRRTQLDSHSGLPISRERFFRQSGWSPEQLAGAWVLDVGSGAGRFAEVALRTGAHVVAVDYSSAAEACFSNLGPHPRLEVVQADVYRLPFEPEGFDFVYSFGVLQHTPDGRGALLALSRQACAGGRLAVDLYPKMAINLIWPKYWLRPLTCRIPPDRLFPWVERAVPALLPLSRLLGRIPRAGRKLRYAVPVANYEGVYPLGEQQLREWAVLDTFDMLSPVHDHPQSAETLRRWLAEAGLEDAEVLRPGLLVGRGRKPVAAVADARERSS